MEEMVSLVAACGAVTGQREGGLRIWHQCFALFKIKISLVVSFVDDECGISLKWAM